MDPLSKTYRLFVYQVADLAVVAVALTALYVAFAAHDLPDGIEPFLTARVTVRNALLCGFYLVFWHVVARAAGLYAWTHRTPRRAAQRVVLAATVGACGALIFPLESGSGLFSFAVIGWFWIVVTLALLSIRAAAHGLRTLSRPVRQILIVGTGPLADKLCRELAEAPDPVALVGFVDSRDAQAVPPRHQTRFLGHVDALDRILMHRVVDEVVVALPVKSEYDSIQCVIATCERVGVQAAFSTDLFDYRIAKPTPDLTLDGDSLVHLAVAARDGRLIVKRAMDVLLASAALVCFAPLMIAIAIAIKLTSPGPVMFVQERFGFQKRRFRMLKFRTMVTNAEDLQAALENQNEVDGPAFKIRKDPRITPLGSFLRKTSLDELPQLINVVRSDMSLVGPRPLPLRDVSRFEEPWLMRRFSVKPGLTCLWQINGRSDTDFSHWINQDLHYIDNWSLALDVTILARTLPAVLRGTGAA